MIRNALGSRAGLLSAIGLLALAGSAGSALAADISAITMMKGADRQARLEKGAKAEGQFTLYTTLRQNQAGRPLQAGFEKKYPYIKFQYVQGSSAPLVQKIMTESRAGQLKADVAVGSTSAALNKAKLLEPYVSPEFAVYDKAYAGPGNLYVTYRNAFYGIAYNTKRVSEADAPKEWEDLLNPKWKGEMVWSNGLETGGTFVLHHLRQVWGEKKAAAFFDKLATQQISASNASIRALLDLVIAGEHSILISSALHHVIISKTKGAPVWFASPNPAMNRPDHLQLLKGAPHPHAAMLFIDYLLSKEGQQILAKAQYLPAHPAVDPQPEMKPIVPRLNGKSERVYPPGGLLSQSKVLKALFKKISR